MDNYIDLASAEMITGTVTVQGNDQAPDGQLSEEARIGEVLSKAAETLQGIIPCRFILKLEMQEEILRTTLGGEEYKSKEMSYEVFPAHTPLEKLMASVQP